MFKCIKGPQKLVYVSNIFINKKQQMVNTMRSFSLFFNDSSRTGLNSSVQNSGVRVNNNQVGLFITRNKYKSAKAGRKKNVDDDSSSDENEEMVNDDDDDDVPCDKNIKIYNVQSMRIDSFLKNCFKLSRKKIEDSFYENKIRINGKVPLKKSQNAKEEDEIDLIIGFDHSNPDYINVKRVVIYKVKYDSDTDRFHVKAESFKSLKIKNYSGGAVWKEAAMEN